MPHRVALVAQANYEPESLFDSISRSIELAGFDLSAVRNRQVLLKPNMLGAYPPHTGITTNPAFVEAAARVFKKAGAKVAVGDSPNGVHPVSQAWEISGIRQACARAEVPEVQFEASGSTKRQGLMIANAALEADILVSLPKFKTHSLTVLTLAVKNLFGCINGMQKSGHHRQHTDRSSFARLLVRIADILRPPLTIIDGIVAMEGNGPSAGKLINMGVIAAGTNVHALDAACARLLDLDPLEMDTLAAACQMGLWSEADPIDILGDSMERLRPQKFALPATYTRGMLDWGISRMVMNRIWSGISVQPAINPKRCKRCGLCVEACPVDAIAQADPDLAPRIETKKCVQCFCCHEVCPYKAIDLKASIPIRMDRMWVKLLSWLSRKSATGDS